MNSKIQKRRNRAMRVRSKLCANVQGKLRLSVFRSNKHFYAQLIDDELGKTLVHVSTLSADIKEQVMQDRKSRGVIVGKFFMKKCSDLIDKKVIFDRGGYPYAGVIFSFAQEVRDLGLRI